MNTSVATASCSLCKQTGHRASNCPELSDPLKLGFHTGGNGGQGHSHDEEDQVTRLYVTLFDILVENETIGRFYDSDC
jgi:hypothetical protein